MERIATLRTEWIARLVEAIEGAQSLAWQLARHDGMSNEARDLYGRLEAARLELDLLSGKIDRKSQQADPDWLAALGWNSGSSDPD